MKLILPKYYSFFLFPFLLCSLIIQAQNPTIKATQDRGEILIGEQFKVKIEAIFIKGEFATKGFSFPDSLEHFEVIDRGKTDTLYSNNKITGLIQNFTFTSFDSGKWLLPSFKIIFTSGNNSPIVLYSDSLPVTVSHSLSDTSNQVRDIKPIREVEAAKPLWYWVVVISIPLLLIAGAIYYLLRKKNGRNKFTSTSISAFDEAIKAIENLKQYNLATVQDAIVYHSELKGILKRYLSRKSNFSFLNKTTADLLVALKNEPVDKKTFTEAASSLRCSDAVQFAKYFPDAAASINCMLAIKDLIKGIEKTNTAQS